MASEFVYVLVAGIAVLVVGGVLAGFADQEATVSDTEEMGEPIISEKLGTIGTIDATSRTIQFGDMTVEARTRESEVASRDSVKVGSSVFGASSETIGFETGQSGRMHLSFVPSKATSQENLVVRVNGERVDVPEFTTGETVEIQASVVRGDNTVTFTAERPGTSFWKTPTYTLDDVSVDVTAPRVVKPFRVFDYEVQGFDRGEIRFSVTEDVIRDTPLEVKINGNTVVSRTPIKRALPYSFTFFSNTTGISAGENVLSLSTSGRSSYPLDNLQLTLFFFAGDKKRSVVKEFSLSSDEHSDLGTDNGRLTLQVDRVTLQRPVTVELPNATFTRTLSAGENTFRFGKSDVSKGSNRIQISTDGSYRVSNMTISIAE